MAIRREEIKDEAAEQIREELLATASQEKEQASQLVQQEVTRRTEQARRTVERMLHIQLAGAFDGFCDQVQASRERKAVARRVISRMLNAQLAGAFDLFYDGVMLAQQKRETARNIIAKWKAPAMRTGWEAWLEYMDDRREEAKEAAVEELKQALASAAEDERGKVTEATQREVERRIVMAQRTVHRMLHAQLAGVFDSFVLAVQAHRERREMATRVISRMLHTQLAAAFDWFCECVDGMRHHKELVARSLAKWKDPTVQTAWEAWLEYMAIRREEIKDEAAEQIREELLATASQEKEQASQLVQQEVTRRTEQARRTVERMLHIQLAGAFDGFCDQVQASRERKAVARRVISRMLNAQLAGAFDLFYDGVMLAQQKRETARNIIAKWKAPAMRTGWEAWLEYMDDRREEAKEAAVEEVRRSLSDAAEQERLNLRFAEESFVLQLETMKAKRLSGMRSIIVRMQNASMAAAFDTYAQNVDGHKRRRENLHKAILRSFSLHAALRSFELYPFLS